MNYGNTTDSDRKILNHAHHDGLIFKFKRTSKIIMPILPEKLIRIVNKEKNRILDIDGLGRPILTSRIDLSTHNNNQLYRLKYAGAGNYHLYNENQQKSLFQCISPAWGVKANTLINPLYIVDKALILLSNDGEIFYSGSNKSYYSDRDLLVHGKNSEIKQDKSIGNRLIFSFFEDTDFPDLIGHYPLDENANDLSEYRRDGAIKKGRNGVKFVTDLHRGKVACFDGVDDYIDTGFSFDPKDYGGVMTLSLWAKMLIPDFNHDSSVPGSTRRIGSYLVSSNSCQIFMESVLSSEHLYSRDLGARFYYRKAIIFESSGINLGMWNHIVVVFCFDTKG